jgi:hypothetical protein
MEIKRMNAKLLISMTGIHSEKWSSVMSLWENQGEFTQTQMVWPTIYLSRLYGIAHCS